MRKTKGQQGSPPNYLRQSLGATLLATGVVLTTVTAAYAEPVDYTGDDILVEAEDLHFQLGDRILPVEIRGFSDGTVTNALDTQNFKVYDDDVASDFNSFVECENPKIDFATKEQREPAGGGLQDFWISTDGSDVVITCDPYDVLASDNSVVMTAQPQLRIWAEKALARYVVTLTNATADSVNYSYQFQTNFDTSSDEGSTIRRTSNNLRSIYDYGSSAYSSEVVQRGFHDLEGELDFYWLMSDGRKGDDLPSAVAWGNTSYAPSLLQLGELGPFGNYDTVTFYKSARNAASGTSSFPDPAVAQLTLGAGESVSYAFFNFAINPRDFLGDGVDDYRDFESLDGYEDYLDTLFAAATATFGGTGDGDQVAPNGVPCELFVGVDVSLIANWECEEGDGEDSGGNENTDREKDSEVAPVETQPALANTGTDRAGFWLGSIAGGLLLLMGAGALVASRRKLIRS